MFEVILTVCAFVNAYSTDLVCEKQVKDELPACNAVIIEDEMWDTVLYHPTRNPRGTAFIKKIECHKMIPKAPPGPGNV